MKCLVSGATGFIGRRLCQQLSASGHTVVALSRNGGPLDSGEPTLAVDLAATDLRADWLQGVDVVFHLAGIAHQQASPAAYTALNYRATTRLASLASAAGVTCFVYLSSVKAMGAPHVREPRTELQVTPPADAYSASKWQAECALRDAYGAAGMSVAIVRPALVYGRQPKGNLRALDTAVRWGLPRPPPIGRRSMIALDDLVSLLLRIAQQPPPGVQTWIACGAGSYSTREIYDLLRAARGRGPGVAWLPHWAWRLGARLIDTVAPGAESTYDKIFGTELYSNAAVTRDTGWQPQLTLESEISLWSGIEGGHS
ncbi:MAG: NAD-dependent epimerase/dehydratase family protein [Halioglobus sp.]|nr:NAD-dependent epimerase/dehydratase family protein [Halioglobus sp.]